MNQQVHQVIVLGHYYSQISGIVSNLLFPYVYYDSYEVTVLHNCEQVKLHIWNPVPRCIYMKDPLVQVPYATAVLLVYDVACRASFGQLKRLYRKARKINRTANVVVVGITGRLDVKRRGREVSRVEAENYAKHINAKYCEVPAGADMGDMDAIRNVLYHLIADLPLPGGQDAQVLEPVHHVH